MYYKMKRIKEGLVTLFTNIGPLSVFVLVVIKRGWETIYSFMYTDPFWYVFSLVNLEE